MESRTTMTRQGTATVEKKLYGKIDFTIVRNVHIYFGNEYISFILRVTMSVVQLGYFDSIGQ
jgi:hypothetical protein